MVKILLVTNLVFLVGGMVLLVMAYRERNRDFPWFSFRLSPFKHSRRAAFNEKGFRYYCAAVPLIVVGGLSGAIYWLMQ